MTVDGDKLTMTNGKSGWYTFHWAVNDDGLKLDLLDCTTQDGSAECPDKDSSAS